MLASTDFVGSMASPFAPVVNGVLPWKPVKAVLDGAFGIDRRRTFPKYSGEKFTTWFRRHAAARQEEFDRFVSFFHGCYANYNYPQLGKDFVKVLNAAGYGVHLLEKEKCCGVALMSNGFAAKARRQGELNLASMRKAAAAGEPVLTCSSTCTFTMRDEYPDVLGLDNSDVRDALSLATRWLYMKITAGAVKLKFREDFRMKVIYHTACHMQKLGWQQFSIEHISWGIVSSGVVLGEIVTSNSLGASQGCVQCGKSCGGCKAVAVVVAVDTIDVIVLIVVHRHLLVEYRCGVAYKDDIVCTCSVELGGKCFFA